MTPTIQTEIGYKPNTRRGKEALTSDYKVRKTNAIQQSTKQTLHDKINNGLWNI